MNGYGIGQFAEQFVARKMGEEGFMVIPASLYHNNIGSIIGAPMLYLDNNLQIAPDLVCIKNTEVRFIEVKTKKQPAFFRIHRQWQHGVDYPNAEAYKLLSDSGYPIDIILFERLTPKEEEEDSELSGPGQWLRISIKAAFFWGEKRDGNIQMRKPHNPKGTGLYWPHYKMERLPWEPLPK